MGPLTGTGNQDGFRCCGPVKHPQLVVLYTTLSELNWPGSKAFANDDRLARIGAVAEERGGRSHEFGYLLLIEYGGSVSAR